MHGRRSASACSQLEVLLIPNSFQFHRPPEEIFENDSFDLSNDDGDYDNIKPRRQHWQSKVHFVFACIGYSVGLSNVFRFPYIMFKSGGGK